MPTEEIAALSLKGDSATVFYRDVNYAEARCEHMEPMSSWEKSADLWRKYRGKPVSINPATFKAGECAGCDSWLLVGETRTCVTRAMIEIGD